MDKHSGGPLHGFKEKGWEEEATTLSLRWQWVTLIRQCQTGRLQLCIWREAWSGEVASLLTKEPFEFWETANMRIVSVISRELDTLDWVSRAWSQRSENRSQDSGLKLLNKLFGRSFSPPLPWTYLCSHETPFALLFLRRTDGSLVLLK